MATKKRKVKRFDEGGLTEEQLKQRGLEKSRGEKVGFLERLMMGNIDEPSSEAYRRFGAGRGRAESVPVEDRTFTPVSEAKEPARAATTYNTSYEDALPVDTSSYTVKPEKVTKETVTVERPAKAGTRSTAARQAPAMQAKTYTRAMGPTADELAAYARQKETERVSKMLKNPEQDAIERVTPEENFIGGPSLKAMNALAKRLANSPSKLREYVQPLLAGPKRKELLEGPGDVPRLPSPGPRPRQTDVGRMQSTSTRARDRSTRKFNEDEGGMEFKRGGKIKRAAAPKATMASRRGDGIAKRGKTRGGSY